MNFDSVLKEVTFKNVRSGGAGGQHVNKVSSKVQLFWEPLDSQALSAHEKEVLLPVLHNRISKDGWFFLESDETRSSIQNKELLILRFQRLLQTALIVPKKRKKTKTPYAKVLQRLENKKRKSITKANRKKPF